MLIKRSIQPEIARHLARGKSILLLGPRQTGKTTLLSGLSTDLGISLVAPGVRQRYERDPSLLAGEIRGLASTGRRKRMPLVTVDEVQRVPGLMDVGQELIDRGEAQFVFTGSSARKLRRGGEINLLPGRVVAMHLDPLTIEESRPGSLNEALLFGSLPAIRTVDKKADKERDLASYVTTYLEEEVRQEALVRNVGAFGRFLDLAGLESGRIAMPRGRARGARHSQRVEKEADQGQQVSALRSWGSSAGCGRGNAPSSDADGRALRAVRRPRDHPTGAPSGAWVAVEVLARSRRAGDRLGARARGQVPADRGAAHRPAVSQRRKAPPRLHERAQGEEGARDLHEPSGGPAEPCRDGRSLAGSGRDDWRIHGVMDTQINTGAPRFLA